MIQLNMLDKEVNIAIDDYNEAILKGIVKIAAKMGISTLQSYQGAQIFEAIGISKEVIDTYFTNTISEVEGITLEDIEKDLNAPMQSPEEMEFTFKAVQAADKTLCRRKAWVWHLIITDCFQMLICLLKRVKRYSF